MTSSIMRSVTECPACGQNLPRCPVCYQPVTPVGLNPFKPIAAHADKIGNSCQGAGLAYRLCLPPTRAPM
jgi:hypothetical protein